MDEKFPRHFLMGMTVIALGLVIVGWFTFSAIRAAKRGNDVITVTGSARQSVKSDYATWAVNVWCLNPEAPPYDCAKKRGKTIRDFLKSRHVPDSSITEKPVRVDQIFGQKDRTKGNEFMGFKCSQRFEIHTSLVDSVEQLTKDISALIPELIEMDTETPQYFYTKLPEKRVALLAEATKDARVRAEAIATSGGGKIGAIRNARMGVFQITAPNSRDVRDYGIYDTATMDKDVTAVVTVTFAVE